MPSTTLGSRLRGHQPRRLRRRPRAAPTPATSTTTPACSAANPCSRSPSPSACSASSAPPTAVFVGKLSLFGAAIDSGRTWLAIVAIVNTVASVFYRWFVDYGGRYRCSGRPAATASSSRPSWAGGGLVDHARQQRSSTTQGVNQARTRRSACGHPTVPRLPAVPPGPLPPRARRGGLGVRRHRLRRVLGEPRPPAKRERAAHQGPVAADRAVAADLEVRPAELPLDLLVALLDPVAQPVQAHHLGQVGRRKRRCPPALGVGQVGDQVPGG